MIATLFELHNNNLIMLIFDTFFSLFLRILVVTLQFVQYWRIVRIQI